MDRPWLGCTTWLSHRTAVRWQSRQSCDEFVCLRNLNLRCLTSEMFGHGSSNCFAHLFIEFQRHELDLRWRTCFSPPFNNVMFSLLLIYGFIFVFFFILFYSTVLFPRLLVSYFAQCSLFIASMKIYAYGWTRTYIHMHTRTHACLNECTQTSVSEKIHMWTNHADAYAKPEIKHSHPTLCVNSISSYTSSSPHAARTCKIKQTFTF